MNPGSTFRHTILAAIVLLLIASPAAEEKRITVYAPQTSYSLNVVERDGIEYVGLLEILEPLGNTSAKLEGQKWKLRFNDIEGQFTEGQTKARAGSKDVELASRFIVEHGRGLVPLKSLPAVLPGFIGGVDLHESARRLFVGRVATSFTAELKSAAPSRLVLSFSAPVNPHIATEPGRLRMLFTREPVVGQRGFSFDDKLISGVSFAERNGSAELTITGGEPLLATFGDGGRTITISAAPQPASAPPPAQAAPTQTSMSALPPPAASPPPPSFVVVVDAAHGGDDPGATLNQQLAEKDATLAFARRLRTELARHGVAAIMLRDSDSTQSLEQRALAANAAHAPVFVTLHASVSTASVNVYTAMLPPMERKPGMFLPWEAAQAGYLQPSRALALAVAAELEKRNITSLAFPAPVRPLNNIAAAAIAIEVGQPAEEKEGFSSHGYQQSVCSAVSSAVASLRPVLESSRR